MASLVTTTVAGTLTAGINGSTDGGPMIYRKYSGSNYINVIGSHQSNGNMTLGYGAVGKTGNSAGYVSTFANFSGYRSVLEIGNNTLYWKSTDAAVQTAIGSDVTLVTRMSVGNSNMTLTVPLVGTTGTFSGAGIFGGSGQAGGDYTIAVGATFSLLAYSNTLSRLKHNAYYSSGWKCRVDGAASIMEMGETGTYFRVAPAPANFGSSNAITFTVPLELKTDGTTLFNGGSVGIGTTNPGYLLDVNGTANIGGALTGTTAAFSGAVTWSSGGSANANTAYTYSQVGHLPLAGGTLTGALAGTSATFSGALTVSGNATLGDDDTQDSWQYYGRNVNTQRITKYFFVTANGTQARSTEVCRLFFNLVHWGTYGDTQVELIDSYFGGSGYLKYKCKAGNSNQCGIELVEASGYTAAMYAEFGAAVDTGVDYGGYDNYYVPVVVGVGAYRQIKVIVSTTRTIVAWTNTATYAGLAFAPSLTYSNISVGTLHHVPELNPTLSGGNATTPNAISEMHPTRMNIKTAYCGTTSAGTQILNSSREMTNIASLAINTTAAGTYKLYCNGTSFFSGAVGIGTTNTLTYKLRVEGTTNLDGALTGTTATFTTVTAALAGNATTSTNTTGNAATATVLATARNIGGVSFNGSANINLPGVNSAGNQNTTGTAAKATILATARNIGGVSFNGSANINLPGVNSAGNQNTTGNAATATVLATARNIGGVSFNGSANINLPGVNSAGTQNTTGTAAKATILATARTIGGVSFNGSANINLPGVNSAGTQNTSGNAATATVLATGRTIAMTGDVTWTSPAFSGSGNVTAAATIATDAVDIAMLSASGTASSSTFLRGDNTWATPTGSTPNNATITLSAGTNLSGGGNFTTNQSSNETITFNMSAGGAGAATYGSTSNGTKIDTITLDAYGRVTAVATGTTGSVTSVATGAGLTGGAITSSGTISVIPPTTASSGPVGIGNTAFNGERTITTSSTNTNQWDVGTPKYIARIEDLPAGTWLIRGDLEGLYNSTTARWAARIIGDSNMMVKQHPEPGYNGLVWNNGGTGSYSAPAGPYGHTWRYIACAGPQDGTVNVGYSPWRYMGYNWYAPLSMAGVIVTTQAGDVWFQVNDFDTSGSRTFKVRNVQLTATRVTS